MFIILLIFVEKRKLISVERRNFEEAKEKSWMAKRKIIFNWTLLKNTLEPVDIMDSFISKEQRDTIKDLSRRSQMDSILTGAINNIETANAGEKFEAIVLERSPTIELKTPNDEIIPVNSKIVLMYLAF